MVRICETIQSGNSAHSWHTTINNKDGVSIGRSVLVRLMGRQSSILVDPFLRYTSVLTGCYPNDHPSKRRPYLCDTGLGNLKYEALPHFGTGQLVPA